MLCNVDRLDKVFFHIIVKSSCQQLAETVKFTVFHMKSVADGTCFLNSLAGIKVFPGVFLYRFCHGESRPWACHIDFCSFIGEFRSAVRSHSAGCHDLFRLVNDIIDIAISLVCFNSGKLRIMTGIHAFITEVAGDFKYAFIPADKKSL